jgi:8-oxo-dGTP pyrophosphatase MutT (NUDIX family)
VFPVSVKGVLFTPDEDVVLLLNERDEWELPGGRLEAGETPQGCLMREIREELSVDARCDTARRLRVLGDRRPAGVRRHLRMPTGRRIPAGAQRGASADRRVCAFAAAGEPAARLSRFDRNTAGPASRTE